MIVSTTPSPSHASHLDPRTVLLAFVSVAVWASTAPTLGWTLVWLGIVYVILFFSSNPRSRFRDIVRVAGWSLTPAIVVLVLYVLFGPSGDGGQWHIGPLTVSQASVMTGLRLSLRLMAFIALARALILWITPSGLAAGLTRFVQPLALVGVGIGYLYNLLFFIARLTPALAEEARIVRLGQESRGYRTGKSWLRRVRGSVALIVPVFAAAIRRSERLALGLTSRGFNPRWVPASVTSLRFGLVDWLVTLALVVIWVLWATSYWT